MSKIESIADVKSALIAARGEIDDAVGAISRGTQGGVHKHSETFNDAAATLRSAAAIVDDCGKYLAPKPEKKAPKAKKKAAAE